MFEYKNNTSFWKTLCNTWKHIENPKWNSHNFCFMLVKSRSNTLLHHFYIQIYICMLSFNEYFLTRTKWFQTTSFFMPTSIYVNKYYIVLIESILIFPTGNEYSVQNVNNLRNFGRFCLFLNKICLYWKWVLIKDTMTIIISEFWPPFN